MLVSIGFIGDLFVQLWMLADAENIAESSQTQSFLYCLYGKIPLNLYNTRGASNSGKKMFL